MISTHGASVVVATTVIGTDTDELQTPTVVNPECRYVCITDQPIKSPVWDIQRVEPDGCPIRQSRKYKILLHEQFPDADATVWLDAAFRMDTDPMEMVYRWLWRHDMMALRHPHRDQIEDEAGAIVKLGLAPRELLDKQIDLYRSSGFVQKQITSTGICVRRNSAAVRRFSRCWWANYQQAGHTRDQMSVDYAAWVTGIDIAYLEGHYKRNPYAQYSLRPRHVR